MFRHSVLLFISSVISLQKSLVCVSSACLDCDPFFMLVVISLLRGRCRGKSRQFKDLKLHSDFPGCSVVKESTLQFRDRPGVNLWWR